MAASEAPMNIYDHGTQLGDKNKIECKYCKKVVSGVYRLKCHLAHKRGDVRPCEEVPPSIKELMQQNVLERKRENVSREIGEPSHLPHERSNVGHKKLKPSDQTGTSVLQNPPSFAEPISEEGLLQQPSTSNEMSVIQREVRFEGEDLAFKQAQKSICKFFYEAGLDFSLAKSPSFQRMVNSVLLCPRVVKEIPSGNEMRGMILEDINKIRLSWPNTGCSILLDGWVDGRGRELVNIIVDCPKGPIYLRSSAISVSGEDVNILESLIDEVLEEVGLDNVVQVMTYSTSASMEKMKKLLLEKHKSLFWTVSASHCLELILKKIVESDDIKRVLDKAKTITKFIHSRTQALSLMRRFTGGNDLVKPSRFKLAMPFLSLENMVLHKENLESMFSSNEWKTLTWASSREGKIVLELVEDASFWDESIMICKATIPLVNVLCLINEADAPQMGYIYETMDQAKETIQTEFKKNTAHYMRFWNVIDMVWDNHLHCELHAAGYYLNPTLFYSSDFCVDDEVSNGLLTCVVRMVQDPHTVAMVTQQLNEYREARGDFRQGSNISSRANVPPALWWQNYGAQYPHLQRLAIRVLSQTCDGGSRYRLKRSLAEKLLEDGRSDIEQQQLFEETFLKYNLHLQQFEPGKDDTIGLQQTESLMEWVVD